MAENDLSYSESIKLVARGIASTTESLILVTSDTKNFASDVGVFSSNDETAITIRTEQIARTISDLETKVNSARNLFSMWVGARAERRSSELLSELAKTDALVTRLAANFPTEPKAWNGTVSERLAFLLSKMNA